MPEGQLLKLKICLVGESSVGKSSLIKRFVFDEFDGTYTATLGAKITKKEISMKTSENGELLNIVLLVWDIMGQPGFRELLQESYFYGAHGIIGVCDTTREDTLLELNSWMNSVHSVTGPIPTVFLGNKCDLEEEREVGEIEIKSFASGYKHSQTYLSSAKTGENVEFIFEELSKRMLKDIV